MNLDGSAEQAVMELLLDSEKLIFSNEQLLDGEIFGVEVLKDLSRGI